MSSSSSSSGDDGSDARQVKKKDKKLKGKKERKAKKDKKSKKGEKKDKKDNKSNKKDDKLRKRCERAEQWICDWPEVVRLVKQLLELDANVSAELEAVFAAIDEGEVVRIDGLENAKVKKKLRHLLQAVRLSPVEGGFKTADSKVSFTSLFHTCLKKASRGLKQVEPTPVRVVKGPTPPPALELEPAELDTDVAISDNQDEDVVVPLAKKKVGPQRPGVGIELAGGSGDSDSDDDAQKEDGQGPRLEGQEREGIDLAGLPEKSGREEWMLMMEASMNGAMGDGGGKKDQFAIGRSKEELEDFEKIFKERTGGKSLLEQQALGEFQGHEEAQMNMRKRKMGPSDSWGISEKEQGKPSGNAARLPGARPAFDPEKDMQERGKMMTGGDFAKLVENSVGALAGRFSRSGVASSFL